MTARELDLISGKLKDKRNRVLERETNELKDELCTMRHIVHILDNIKRVSRDCISYLHLMVDAANRADNNALDHLKDDVQELEEELKVWERKYQLMSSMQTQESLDSSHNTNANNSVANNINSSMITNNNNNNSSNNEDMDGYEACNNGSFYDSDKNDDCAQSSSHNSMVLMPQELCEMSMETHENDHVVINTDNTPPPVSSSSSHLSSSVIPSSAIQMSSGKSLFECEWIGCDFRTNMRQRLVMHKRLHAGEMLFSCDVPGCGYQSNYKGNIKIHKKHRHRIDEDNSGKEYINNTMSHNLNLKKNSLTNNLIRRRKRKKFRYTVLRSSGTKPELMGRSHMASAAANDDASEDSAKDEMSTLFSCPIKDCNYRSKWKQCLTAHQLLHEGVKPYKCDHPGCNYRTNFKGNVNVHKRVHRESQFQCQIDGCQFSTPWKNSFTQHQRNHYLSNTESTANLSNNNNNIDNFENSNENEFQYDDDEDVSTEETDNNNVYVVRKEPVLPLIPVQQFTATSSTNNASELNINATIAQHAQQTLVPQLAIIKSEISHFVDDLE